VSVSHAVWLPGGGICVGYVDGRMMFGKIGNDSAEEMQTIAVHDSRLTGLSVSPLMGNPPGRLLATSSASGVRILSNSGGSWRCVQNIDVPEATAIEWSQLGGGKAFLNFNAVFDINKSGLHIYI